MIGCRWFQTAKEKQAAKLLGLREHVGENATTDAAEPPPAKKSKKQLQRETEKETKKKEKVGVRAFV